jgi:hypothetical protein
MSVSWVRYAVVVLLFVAGAAAAEPITANEITVVDGDT